jgi:hypothetical protein
MAICNIQSEIAARIGHGKVGDYSFFAARAGSMFINANVFALDEYGIPIETARRIAGENADLESLDEALEMMIAADTSVLHPFEREIIDELRES